MTLIKMRKRGPKLKQVVQFQSSAVGKQPAAEKTESNKSKKGIKLKTDNSQRRKYVSEHGNITRNTKDKSATYSDDIFPHWLPWLLFPLTLSLRIVYVLEPTNWWILHPDEIFQTIEVAHSDVFGYGFRPYEYLPPPSHAAMNSTTVSAAHAQEIKFGMFSLRSFVLPKLISGVMILADMVGINTSPYLIIKIFHVTVTSLLPLVVFQFSRTLHRSRDIGCLSAILVSSSMSLNIFGTHTLINSFLAPVFFICLIPLVDSLTSLEMLGVQESTTGFRESSDSRMESNTSNGQNVEICETNNSNSIVLGCEIDCRNKQHTQTSQHTKELNRTFSSHDENANCIYQKQKISNAEENDYFKDGTRNSGIMSQIKICNTLAGTGLALCIYIRVDLIFIPSLFLACFYQRIFKNIFEIVKILKPYAFGIVLGIFIGGYCDYVTYGRWFTSPNQWYKFNVRNSFAGKIFGIYNWYFYLLKLNQNEPLVTMSFIILFIDILDITHRVFTPPNKHSQPAKNQCLIVFIFLLLAFSLNSHKELRFLHNAVVFMYVEVSSAICSMLKRFASYQNGCQYSIYFVYIFIALFSSSHCFYFVNMRFEERSKWTYGQNIDSHETNICLDFIRQQKYVTGVFMDRSVHMSGAYSQLHHDVPIFALNIFEYLEYKKPRHLSSLDDMNLSSTKRNGYSTFTNISDFISVYNSQYMFKRIRQSAEYNFLILKTSSNFIETGYNEVFRVGNSKILTRTFDKQKEKDLANTTDNVHIFWNATILEYEGNWLKHYGLYTKAEQRLLTSNRIDPKRIGTFRILLDMFSKLKQTDDYRSVLKACLQIFRKNECQKPYTPIMLHPGYYRNI